jgi:ATP-dependent Lon protease
MSSLPIFPLPNTVVFPGMTVPLYVFEARYRKLVSYCLEQERPQFIITLNKKDTLLSESLPFYSVGSVVQVVHVSQNPDGTYQLLGHGQERCKIEISSQEDVAEPDGSTRPLFFSNDIPWSLERHDPNQERITAWDALEIFRTYASIFFTPQLLGQLEDNIPDDLIFQASFICANIRIPADLRQILLEAPSLIKRFQLAQDMMQERLKAHQPDTKQLAKSSDEQ